MRTRGILLIFSLFLILDGVQADWPTVCVGTHARDMSFMRMRPVPVHGTLSGRQFVATVHFMQLCRRPRLIRAHLM